MSRLAACALVVLVACSDPTPGPQGAAGERGPQGNDGTSCSVAEVEPGLRRITCSDGTTVDLQDGVDGADGKDGVDGEDGETGPKGDDGTNGLDAQPCTVTSVDGGARITCPDGTEAFIANGENGVPGENGADGEDGADGEPGADGTSCSVITTNGVKEIVCSDGTRVTVEDGADGKDGVDGTDGEDGVDGTDGTNGTNGTNGKDGTNGTNGTNGKDGTNGTNGTNGTSGTNGTNGTNGVDSLVRLDDESEGDNCEYGGTKVSSGRDTDRDGTLDEEEVEDVAFVCRSAAPTTSTCTVFEGDMVIRNSLDLDAFSRLGCPEIAGNLTVEGVSDLSKLAFLRRVDGILLLANLRSIAIYLPALAEVTGSFSVQSNARLAGLELPALASATTLVIQDNPLLESVSIGEGFVSTQSFEVVRNARLVELEVPGLASTSFLALIGNTSLAGCLVDALVNQISILPGGSSNVTDNGVGCARSPLAGELVINEILADPPGTLATDLLGDANGDGVRESSQDEFIEIVNRSTSPLNLTGVKVHRNANVFTAAPYTNDVKFTFPALVLAPGKAVVVFGGGTVAATINGAPAFRGSQLALGDTSYLLLTLGSTELDRVSYNAAASPENVALSLNTVNRSATRWPDRTGAWSLHSDLPSGRPYSPGLKADGTPF